MLQSRCALTTVLTLSTLTALGFLTPLSAQVPFNGGFHAALDPNQITPIDATHEGVVFDVTGSATILDNFSGTAHAILNTATLAYTDGFVGWSTVGGNGDIMYLTFQGQFVPTAIPNIFDNVETFGVVGGTGQFAGATGSGTAGGQFDFTTVSSVNSTPFTGTVTFVPEPGSIALLIGVTLTGTGFLARRHVRKAA